MHFVVERRKVKRTGQLRWHESQTKWKPSIMRKRDGKIIIWPAYLDSTLTRAQGRRIPKNLGAPDISVKILKEAADSAGFDSEVEAEKVYPRSWNQSSGYLVVENPEKHKKKRLLLMLAKSVRRVVAKLDSARKAAEKKKKAKKKKKR